jgi:hypothetical protein
MTPVDKGRFCGSCQKQVIDFTSMSDEQLAMFFKKPIQGLSKNGSVCGRFMQDQLNRRIAIPKKRIPWVKYFFQFALPAFLLSSKAVAQGKVRTLKGDTVMISKPEIEEIIEKKVSIENEKKIVGKVVDENDMGIPYASVFVKGTTIGLATDSAGNFSLKYSNKEESIILVSSCVGFQNTETIVSLNKTEHPIIISLAYGNALAGVVIFGYPPEIPEELIFAGGITVGRELNIMDTICKKIFPSKQSLKLYPNPIRREGSLTIEMDKHKTGTYLFQLAALNGQIVYNKGIWIDESDRLVTINIPPVSGGTYLVSMTNKKSGKSNTEKIIVE